MAPKKTKDEKAPVKKAKNKKAVSKKAADKKAADKKAADKRVKNKKAVGKKAADKKAPSKKAAAKKAADKKVAKKSSSATGSLPGTLERSPAKVQRTYEKTLASAEAGYGDEARAHRTAWGSVKNVAEKRGDHWELKESTGPSDPRSTKSTEQKRAGEGETFGGVDVLGNTRDQLVERAKKAGIRGYSRMTKAELGRQLSRHE